VYFIYFTATGCALIRQSDNVPEKRGMLWCRLSVWWGEVGRAPPPYFPRTPPHSSHLRVCVESAGITRALLIWYANTAKNESKGGAKGRDDGNVKSETQMGQLAPFWVNLLRNTFVYLQFKVSNEVRCEDIKRE